jgi:peroxiredoxin
MKKHVIAGMAGLTALLAVGGDPAGAQRCRYPYGLPVHRTTGHTTNPLLGESAPPIQLKQLDGSIHTLAEFRDERNLKKVLVLHFTKPGSALSERAAPLLESLWRDYDKKEVQIIAVVAGNGDNQMEAAQSYRNQNAVTFPVALDLDGQASAAYSVTTYPTTFVVDPTDRICFVQAGGFNGGAVDKAVRRFRRWFPGAVQ